jgi:DmsE family decaheme c-type cytochrome
MSVYLKGRGLFFGLAGSVLLWMVAFIAVGISTPSAGGAPVAAKIPTPLWESTQAQVAAAQGADYVGMDVCLSCHDPQGATYGASSHHRIGDPRSPGADRACETCHGPGRLHARADAPETVSIRNFTKLPAEEINATCTSCHNTSGHVLWDGSVHEARGLSCVNCHSQHSAKTDERLLIGATQMETCGTCHRDKVAKLDRSGHMPVREGKMECSTCHNPHGSTNERLLRVGDSIAEQCTSCHAEKRGPFLWEHAPARDGCVTCHDPHGSANERMLVARPPILCQRCHVARQHPSTIYDAGAIQTSIRVYARSCVTCHATIHGSNHPAGQRFIR